MIIVMVYDSCLTFYNNLYNDFILFSDHADMFWHFRNWEINVFSEIFNICYKIFTFSINFATNYIISGVNSNKLKNSKADFNRIAVKIGSNVITQAGWFTQ